MIELLSIEEFEKAAAIVKKVAARTELVYSDFFSFLLSTIDLH